MDIPQIQPLIETQVAGREALRIISVLRDAGFVAVLAGGCVRDCLLGRVPKDFDVATDAVPSAVRDLFGHRRTLAFGQSFGVIGVLPPHDGSSDATILPTEVATFRADGEYSDGRRPDSVTFGDAIADASRRDFTINGMFYDPIERRILDYVGGLDDLPTGRIRTIGDPARRFDEDKLRLLRAVRFATTLQFELDPRTRRAIGDLADEIQVVSGERIGAEMRRILASRRADVGLRLLVETGLSRQVWPHLIADDPDRWTTLVERMETPSMESLVASVTLKPGRPESEARRCVKDLNHRWKLSGDEVRAIVASIESAPKIIECETLPWSKLQPIVIDRDIQTILATAIAIGGINAGIARVKDSLKLPSDQLDPPPLVTGADLVACGHRPGPNFRSWLQTIRDAQLDGAIASRHDALQHLEKLQLLENAAKQNR